MVCCFDVVVFVLILPENNNNPSGELSHVKALPFEGTREELRNKIQGVRLLIVVVCSGLTRSYSVSKKDQLMRAHVYWECGDMKTICNYWVTLGESIDESLKHISIWCDL